MIRILLAFIIAFVICYFGISGFRNLTGKERWALTKLLAYSIMCSVLAITILAVIVVLF